MSRWAAALRLLGLGWYVGILTLLGVLGGIWLDNKFDSKPILVIVGLILGVTIAFCGVYQMLLPLIKNKQNKEDG